MLEIFLHIEENNEPKNKNLKYTDKSKLYTKL